MVCILTGSINGCFLSIFVHWTAGAEHADNNSYYNDNEWCDGNTYDCVMPASQTQRLRVTVTGNVTIKMFNNLAQFELNTKYIC